MNSHVHIGLYDALREAGASEEKALAAVADLPIPQHLASKEDLLKAISGVNDRIAAVNNRIAAVETGIAEFKAAMETRFNDKFAPLDRGMAILKFGYGPIIIGLLIKIAFF